MHSLLYVNFILKYLTTQNSYHYQGGFCLGGHLQHSRQKLLHFIFTSIFHHSVTISLLDTEQVSWHDRNQTNQLILHHFACPLTKSHIVFCNWFKPLLNHTHFFFFLGIIFNGMLETKKKLRLCRKPNKMPVGTQCVDDDLSAGTNQPCPGLCVRGH